MFGGNESAALFSTPSNTQWTWRGSICRCGSTIARATSQSTWFRQWRPVRMPELEARWFLFPNMSSHPHHLFFFFLNHCHHHSLEWSLSISASPWMIVSSLSSTTSRTLYLWRSLQIHIYPPSHLSSRHTFAIPEPDRAWDFQATLLWLLSLNTVYLVSMRGLWMPCLPISTWIRGFYFYFFFPPTCRCAYRTNCSWWRDCPAVLLVDLFINGLRVLCVLKGQCCTMNVVTLT